MDCALGIHIELPIGIALALAIDEHILHTAPLACLHIVAVHHQVSPARTSRAVGKKQVAALQVIEFGVSHIALVHSRHGHHLAQLQRTGSYRAAIAQRIVVVVERDMQIPLSIHPDADDIVCIGAISLVLRALHRPILCVYGTFAQGEIALGIVISYVLSITVCGE